MGKFPKKEKAVPKFKNCSCCKIKGNTPGTCPDCRGSGQIRIVHSRNKGNNFERNIAKILTQWTGTTIARTPSSGGWAKSGDITPKDPAAMVKFPFTIELKNRQGWDMHELITGSNYSSGIVSWWLQSKSDSYQSNKIPVLVFTRNLDVNYIMMNMYVFGKIFNGVPIDKKPVNFLYQILGDESVCIFKFDDLLAIPYNEVCESVRGI